MVDTPSGAEQASAPEHDSPGGHAPWRSAWPAYACAAGLLVYAVMKATYAVQGKLGLPGGVEVPPSAYEELGHVGLRQGMLAAMGAGGALLALASVQGWGRRIPRWLMLLAMWGALVPMLAGAPIVMYRVVTGPESVASRLLDLAQALTQLTLWCAATVLYQRRSRQWRKR